MDPDNRLVWRTNFRRLEVEALRDSGLFVAGLLDERVGGPPQELERPASKKRTIYGRVTRSPYGLLTLFDYPDPNITSEQREVTNVPLQGLFFMNSDLIQREAEALLARLGPEGPTEEESVGRIQRAYRFLFQREASQAEVQRGLEFLKKADAVSGVRREIHNSVQPPQASSAESTPAATLPLPPMKTPEAAGGSALPAGRMTPWQQYAQALLSAGEFYYVN